MPQVTQTFEIFFFHKHRAIIFIHIMSRLQLFIQI